MGRAFHDAPSVIVTPEACNGTVMSVAGVHHGANFVQRNPAPGEFDIGKAPLFDDASDGDQFASGSGNAERLLFRIAGREQSLDSINTCRCKCCVPTGWRHRGRTPGNHARNPAALLEGEILGRKVVLIGNDASSQFKLPCGAESGGTRNQISSQAASEKVAGRAGREQP